MNYKIAYPHGIMFHHFHNELHPKGQGSISASEFDEILHFIGLKNIINAVDWQKKYKAQENLEGKVCITFDDSLKCQYDIAKPILDKYGIKAFFFVYSSVLEGKLELLEIFRYYRSKYFTSFDDFFEKFMNVAKASLFAERIDVELKNFDVDSYLKNFSFYSKNDKVFRFLRDHVLKVDNYNKLMLDMMKADGVETESLRDLLWMKIDEVQQLSLESHLIGLHSDSHPTTMAQLSVERQKSEYVTNKSYLEKQLSVQIKSMSHPCNSYTSETISLLKDMGLDIGFRANMQPEFSSPYEIPREDHINVLKMLRESK